MSNRLLSYPGSSALTFTSVNSLASDTNLKAGAESTLFDNSVTLYLDAKLSGEFTTGTTPTVGQILVYVVAEKADGSWPDVFDGTDSAETVTSAGIRDACCKLAAPINMDSTSTNVVFPFEAGSIAALFGGFMPRKFVVFVVHNTVAAFKSSGHVVTVTPVFETI